MEPTEDIIKREIAAAREIIRSDRIMGKLNKHFPDEEPEDDGNPKAPKKKDDPPVEPPKRGGIWWGEATASE